MSNIEIGERIRELRESRNYTWEGFAEKVDISSKFLYEVEIGKKGFFGGYSVQDRTGVVCEL